jgi:HPt (histidine-containing phosphotransfer) domain-containing protein
LIFVDVFSKEGILPLLSLNCVLNPSPSQIALIYLRSSFGVKHLNCTEGGSCELRRFFVENGREESGTQEPPVEDAAPCSTPPVVSRNPAIPESSPFNLDEAIVRLDCEPGLFREMIGFFFEDGPKLLAEIQTAVGAGDAIAIEKKAHRLKGTVLYLGADSTNEAVSRVEALGRVGDLKGAAEAIRALEAEMTRLAEALRPFGPAPP